MKPLPIEFEPNASFCYRLARYHLLPELAQEPEALSGEPFKLNPVIYRVLSRYLTEAQMGLSYPARDAEGKCIRSVQLFGSLFLFGPSEALSRLSFGLASPGCIA